jgi:hypothetical protein
MGVCRGLIPCSIDALDRQLLKSGLELICVSLYFADHEGKGREDISAEVEYLSRLAGKILFAKSEVDPERLLHYNWIGLTDGLVVRAVEILVRPAHPTLAAKAAAKVGHPPFDRPGAKISDEFGAASAWDWLFCNKHPPDRRLEERSLRSVRKSVEAPALVTGSSEIDHSLMAVHAPDSKVIKAGEFSCPRICAMCWKCSATS